MTGGVPAPRAEDAAERFRLSDNQAATFSPGIDLWGAPVLVTGGTGFLGTFVVPELVRAGCRVTVVGDPGRGDLLAELIRGGDVRFVQEADWWRPTVARRVARLAAGAEHLVHLAYVPVPPGRGTPTGQAHHETRVNLAGTTELLLALGDRLGHVILRSSVEVFGRTPPLPIDEATRPTPDDAYGAAKLALEDQLRVTAAAGGPEATVLRFTTLYGPGETASRLVSTFIRAGLAGCTAHIVGDGLERRDHLHVRDAAQLVVRALARPPGTTSDLGGFRLVNGASGTPERTVALAQRVRRIVAERTGGLPPAPEHLEGHLAADVVCRTDRARDELGFEPTVALDEGLAEEVAWFAEHAELWRDLSNDALL